LFENGVRRTSLGATATVPVRLAHWSRAASFKSGMATIASAALCFSARMAHLMAVPEVLVNVYFEERRPSLSCSGTWMASVAWIDRIRPILTARAYSGFASP
jgi:hypothetical protein